MSGSQVRSCSATATATSPALTTQVCDIDLLIPLDRRSVMIQGTPEVLLRSSRPTRAWSRRHCARCLPRRTQARSSATGMIWPFRWLSVSPRPPSCRRSRPEAIERGHRGRAGLLLRKRLRQSLLPASALEKGLEYQLPGGGQ